jgi:serine/threonine protein kinase/tetratricopeptide (TPR) repeat protein
MGIASDEAEEQGPRGSSGDVRGDRGRSANDKSSHETIAGGSSMLASGSGTAPTIPASGDMEASWGPVERVGAGIGRYKLLQQIGEGGFGSVFLAEQSEPVRRRVALKTIKLGMDTRQVIARFEQERQALAQMDHPGIAKVFDAGATDSGRPYFVMEFCPGESITQFCDRNRLTIPQRLELFVQVCQAVQHAHQRGLIHRDLKPSNILVSAQDGKPQAKVIDFGIAKATASKLTEKTLFTEAAQLVGTPQYMSPEQAEGNLDIDTRTDIYALGVLLYELLAGVTPFDPKSLRSAAHAEIQRVIREVDPPRPSTRISESAETAASVAATRRIEPGKLQTIIRGELDWIVMKALEKDRSRRYETANAFAADVLRYLSGEVVLAAPPSTMYRARKFVRRHRGVVIAASMVAAALVLGVIGTSIGLAKAMQQSRLASAAQIEEARQHTLAENRLKEAEETIKFLDEMLGSPDLRNRAKSLTVQDVLDVASKSLGAQFGNQPLVAARLHGTVGRTYLNVGDFNAAEKHLNESHAAFLRELGPDHPDTCRAVNFIGMVLLKKGQYPQAQEVLTRALKDHERLFGRTNALTTESMDALSQLYVLMERRQDAVRIAGELLDIRTATLGKDSRDTVSAMNTLAMLYSDLNKFEESRRLFDEALAIQERIAPPDDYVTLQLRGNLAWLDYESATMLKESNPEQYKRLLTDARRINEQVLKDRTRTLGGEHPDTLQVMNNLGTVYKELDMYDEADKLAAKDIEISIKTLGESHPDAIAALANMGNSLRSRKRFDEAIVYLDRALKNARKSLPTDAEGLAYILGWYGTCLRAKGRYAEGEPMVLEARGIIVRTMGEDHMIAGKMALDLQRLYQDWDKAEPGKGYDVKAAEWKNKAPHTAPPSPTTTTGAQP